MFISFSIVISAEIFVSSIVPFVMFDLSSDEKGKYFLPRGGTNCERIKPYFSPKPLELEGIENA